MSSTVLIADFNGINPVNVNAIERELKNTLNGKKYKIEKLSNANLSLEAQTIAAIFLVDGRQISMLGSLAHARPFIVNSERQGTALYLAGGGLLACTQNYWTPDHKSSISYGKSSGCYLNGFSTVGPCFERPKDFPSSVHLNILSINCFNVSGYVFSSKSSAFSVDECAYIADSYSEQYLGKTLHSTLFAQSSGAYKRLFTNIHPELNGDDVNEIFKQTINKPASEETIRQVNDSHNFRQALFRRNLVLLDLDVMP